MEPITTAIAREKHPKTARQRFKVTRLFQNRGRLPNQDKWVNPGTVVELDPNSAARRSLQMEGVIVRMKPRSVMPKPKPKPASKRCAESGCRKVAKGRSKFCSDHKQVKPQKPKDTSATAPAWSNVDDPLNDGEVKL